MIADKPQFTDREDGLSPDQRTLLKQPLRIPAGFGLRVLSAQERLKRMSQQNLNDDPGPRDILQVWEPPRKGFLYVVSADISSGLELDNTVVEVTRVGTTREPDEQVAQFVTNTIDETDIASVIDAIGRLYVGRDSQPAMVAIECNGMGIATQSHLIKAIGYTNLYIWQYLDAVEGHEFTTRYGWWTTPRTRPLILQRYVHAIRTVDPATGYADYRVNSPWTLHEMSDFQSPGPLWLAEAVDGAHDDCIMAGAIGVFVATTLQYNQRETVHDTRRRVNAEVVRAQRVGDLRDSQVSFQTTDTSYEGMMGEEFDQYGDSVNPYDDVEHYI